MEDIHDLGETFESTSDEIVDVDVCSVDDTLALVSWESGGSSVRLDWRTANGHMVHSAILLHPKKRCTCVSTQIGCQVGCVFCSSHSQPFHGNLSRFEIMAQIIDSQSKLRRIEKGRFWDRILFAGTGEPLRNLDNVVGSIEMIESQRLAPVQYVVWTVGDVRTMERLSGMGFNLSFTLSLHFPNDAERMRYMPGTAGQSVEDLVEVLAKVQTRRGTDVKVHYVLLYGLNDTPEHLSELVDLLHGSGLEVQLASYNRTCGGVRGSGPQTRERFRVELERAGIRTSLFDSRGVRISAGCGQMGGEILTLGERIERCHDHSP
jgi:23S rRNA (adenine2503-C2)-methyltransferase